ncbi:MAG UNVERIFIED_CONTAM: hypothetical protein LVR29_23645 [Microcystis novacekii LVE1205-3]|jgi:formylglycine-generating enzyme required for sulfatase activity
MPTIIIQKTQKRLLIYREKLTDDLDIELVKIPSGTFTMGSSEQEVVIKVKSRNTTSP